MKKLLLLVFGIVSSFGYYSQTIADARNQGIGQTVTITGVSLNGAELGAIRYIQDGTAALPAYGNNLSSIQRGDSVTATGVLFDFSGLLEISPTNSFTILGSGTLPNPQLIPITSVNEDIEAELVRIDNVTFVQSGTFATGNSTVQITDGTNTLDVRINGSTNIDGTAIPTGAVSIVAMVGQFNANYQLVPRDLNDIFPYVAPAREINVLMNSNTVLNNSTFVVGNSTSTAVTVENTGSQNLNISNTTITGANAADFSIDLTSAVIGANGSQNYTLSYSPSGTGTRTATLNIFSDDADENPYIIDLYAVGTDNLATEPSSNPSSFTFPLIKPYTLSGLYTAASNAENYLVLWKNGSAITGTPQDGTSYKRGDVVGDAKVAYVGSGTGFTPRHVIANQNYYFAVYAFNGPSGYENYLTSSPATANVTSQGSQIGNYYNGINSNSNTLISDLSSLINPHQFISYFNYKTTMMNQFEVRDTTNGESYVLCAYSGERKVFNDPFDWVATGYSREHTFSHSWMPTYPCDNPEQAEYNDQHNLYPTNLTNANTPRSNLPLDEITGSTVYSFLECSVGYNASNQLCFTPRNDQKGNAARAIFYMATCYNGQLGNNWQIPSNQNQETLKNWHFADQPDNYEIARHEYIYSLQNNRNPFIDSVDFACNIDFSSMTYQDCISNVEDMLLSNLSIFPVPSQDDVYFQINGLNIEAYNITDLNGRIIDEDQEVNLPVLKLNKSNLGVGTFFISITTKYGKVQERFILN